MIKTLDSPNSFFENYQMHQSQNLCISCEWVNNQFVHYQTACWCQWPTNYIWPSYHPIHSIQFAHSYPQIFLSLKIIHCRLIYLVMVLKEYYHQTEELGITVWHTMGNNMENTFPNFCIFLIGSGAVSYAMAFCQLTMVDNSEG